MNHARKIWTLAGVVCLTATVGCKEDPPIPTLFEEEGAWSLIRYDLVGDGDVQMLNNSQRENAFMLLFDTSNNVVTAAACVNEAEGQFTPADSSCRLSADDSSWQCSCYGYAFENEKMLWREFEAGGVPPEVSFDEMADGGNTPPPATGDAGGSGGSGGATDGGGDAADGGVTPTGDFEINLAEASGLAGAYTFLPLPPGLFGSNGTASRFVFQTKSALLFDQVFEDPEGRAGCSPCI